MRAAVQAMTEDERDPVGGLHDRPPDDRGEREQTVGSSTSAGCGIPMRSGVFVTDSPLAASARRRASSASSSSGTSCPASSTATTSSALRDPADLRPRPRPAHRLVAVVFGPGGEARRAIRAALTNDARYGLIAYLANTGAEIVAADALVRGDPVARRALGAGLVAWAAPAALVAAIACAAAITDPVRIAAMPARLPRVPLLRAQLRRLPVAMEPRQVPLL